MYSVSYVRNLIVEPFVSREPVFIQVPLPTKNTYPSFLFKNTKNSFNFLKIQILILKI